MIKTTFTFILTFFSIALIAQPTAGLVGHFNCNNNLTNTGTTSIAATNYNVAFGTNSVGTTNSALQFNGSLTSYVSLTDNGNIDFAGDFTISMAINLSSLTTSQGIIDNCLNYGGYGIYYFASDKTLRFNFKNGSIGAPWLTANSWKAITIQRSGTTIKIYINGTLSVSGTEGTQAVAYNYNTVLGQMFYHVYTPTGNYNFISNGSKLDEIRFYNRALSDAEITSLTPFTLPTSIKNFNVVLKNNLATLAWEIAANHATKTFEIEKSEDSKTFTKISSLEAQRTINNYSFIDKSIATTTATNIYYRIVEHDINGSFKYSNTLKLSTQLKEKGLYVFPNPAKSNLNISINVIKTEIANAIILDNLGKQVLQKSISLQTGINTLSININGIKPGMYWLKIMGKELNESKQIALQ